MKKIQSKLSQEYNNTKLAAKIKIFLKKQGFQINGIFLEFDASTKDKIRKIHAVAIKHLLTKNREFIEKNNEKFRERYIADGAEISYMTTAQQPGMDKDTNKLSSAEFKRPEF